MFAWFVTVLFQKASKEDIALPDSSVIKDSFTSSRSAFSPTMTSKQKHSERNSVITNTRNAIGLTQSFTSDSTIQDRLSNSSRMANSSPVDISSRSAHETFTLTPDVHTSIPSHFGTICTVAQLGNAQQLDNNCFNLGSRHQQVGTSIYHPCTNNTATNSSDMNRVPGPMCDWPTQLYTGNQQEYTSLPRPSEQNFYGQFSSIRPQGFDCGSYGYYDCSTSGRGFIPVTGDITFPCISDKTDIINNNGKRRSELSQDKSYKRHRNDGFSMDQHLDEGFV